MLYATNPSQQYAMLIEALRDAGIYDKAIEILPEYLDLNKPRNNALLDEIKVQGFGGQSRYYFRQKLEKAIDKEIDRVNSEELYERWFLYIHAVAGNECDWLGLYWGNLQWDKRRALILNAFRSRFGDDAEAVLFAISIDTRNTTTQMYFHVNERKSPEVCLCAGKYVSNDVVRAVLGMLALDGMEIPEDKNAFLALFTGKGKNPMVEEALAYIRAAAQNIKQYAASEDYILAALAEASAFSSEYRKLFEATVGNSRLSVAEAIGRLSLRHPSRIFDAINELPYTSNIRHYISSLAGVDNALQKNGKHLRRMAERFPKDFIKVMDSFNEPSVIVMMDTILRETNASYCPAPGNTPIERSRRLCVESLSGENPQYKSEISSYLHGETDLEAFMQILPNLSPKKHWWGGASVYYIDAFGMDDFAERCICYHALVNHTCGNFHELLRCLPGIDFRHHTEQVMELLRKQGLPWEYLLNVFASLSISYYSDADCKKCRTAVKNYCSDYVKEFADVDTKQLCAEGRALYIVLLGKNGGYKEKLVKLTDDGSKAVRAVLCEYLPHEEDLIRSLLTAKKGAKREMAVTLLEKEFPETLRADVEQAFAVEKTNAVKKRLADLLGAALPEETQSAMTGDVITELTKGNKAKKVAWLFEKPFAPVRKSDGTEAEAAYLQALLLCYANANPLGRSATADGLASGLNTDDLERFTADVFARWVNAGAQAKTKWVLYFTAVHGGLPMVEALQKYIKDWSEHSRGAIAAETVGALAMNGSSIALIAVDNMARKFKNKQVRTAAGAALERAAEELHLTREELADQIVPDLGFDENLCRMFDFGTRQFKVYLTPALELEIYEGEKRLKNLPKPGTKDDPEKSAAAVKEFKEMKKQMKAAIQSQRQRLEYVLLCDRKWTADGWRDLFIRKAVMHSFAIGLIWGVYKNGALVQSFRYMEDGSFNTPDEEEYILPEGAEIGLVHPMELDEETLSAWREQLEDYEITQPFLQLDRPVYRLTEEEKKQKGLYRFEDTEISDIMLLGRMAKLGWDKGPAHDAGMFYEFTRTDIMKQVKKEDGTMERIGYCTELRFSGMYAGGFDYSNADEVTIGKIEFCPPGAGATWTETNQNALQLDAVSERYMSEIIAQLMSVLSVQTEES